MLYLDEQNSAKAFFDSNHTELRTSIVVVLDQLFLDFSSYRF